VVLVIPAPFRYVRATSVEHALELLEAHGDDAKLLAGGHSLLPLMKLRLAVPEVLVDVGRLDDLSYVRDDGDEVVVGAMTRHHTLSASEVLRRHLPLVAHTASLIGDPQVRHRGTLGGALAHGDPAADLAGAVLATDASMVIRGAGGTRRVPADEFFRGFWETAVGPDELLIEVRIPKPAEAGWDYQKFTRRTFDWAIVGVAVSGHHRPRVALVNMGPTVVRARATEEALASGAGIDEAAELVDEGLSPPEDQGASADYRRHLARVHVRRALTAARGRALS
jgi:carbon-monoxide dehydrogenase medium subunit